MKTGRVGSIPNNATVFDEYQTQALSNYLSGVGQPVFCINTLVVGLDAVESGYSKPEGLDISWSPADPKLAARRARKFALDSVLVHVSEAMTQYVTAISTLPQFLELRKQWKEKERSNKDENKKGEKVSNAEKLVDVAAQLCGNKEYLIFGSALLIHWRNRVVHSASNAHLKHHQKMILLENEEDIKEQFSNLSVTRMLCHIEESHPTLKDITSLISMSIRLVRLMDKKVYENFEKRDLDSWLDHYGILDILEKVKRETSPDKREDSIRRVFHTHAPKLLEAYLKFR